MSGDIQAIKDGCADCNRNAPSQAATPPRPSSPPSAPFEAVFADFFDYGGRHYLVVGDRLSGWVEVLSSTAGTALAGSAGLVQHLRSFFATFGVPEELSSDGGPEFKAIHTEDFLRLWHVKHCVSSVSFPQSNGWAEVVVKTAKRLLMSNTGQSGGLDQDRFLHAMLQLRNTPDPDCNLSPAQIIFSPPPSWLALLRGSLSFVNCIEKFSNPHIRLLWREAWAAKEDALRTRMSRTTESLGTHSRPLRPLALGERVFLQNQQGPSPHKWDRSGIVVELPGHDKYRVRVDGSGCLTLCNRRFLRAYMAATPCALGHQPPPIHPGWATPKGIAQRQAVGPRNSAMGASPLAPAGETSSDLTVPTGAFLGAPLLVPQSPPKLPQPTRPGRVRRPSARYEPESGSWI
ncbi:hypothetical protein CgunFtcFv8_013340 [Champsocephalus gunnari]|uniref:Integrase catalytic domain-containing protein n=1 Tax=Champsocephalus gunnari TaxID=52237 RepID=A0AAN8DTI1_CHAGU|nr:hypothetical protein CgunFtcFv8_013340 [Champsocephalus gunnari]